MGKRLTCPCPTRAPKPSTVSAGATTATPRTDALWDKWQGRADDGVKYHAMFHHARQLERELSARSASGFVPVDELEQLWAERNFENYIHKSEFYALVDKYRANTPDRNDDGR